MPDVLGAPLRARSADADETGLAVKENGFIRMLISYA
jgi:hypothetical protein